MPLLTHHLFTNAFSISLDALKLYTKVGEKASVDSLIWTEKRRTERAEGSEESAEKLLERVPSVKDTPIPTVENEVAVVQVEAVAEVLVPEVQNDVSSSVTKRPRDTPTSAQKSKGKPKKPKQAKEQEFNGKQYLKKSVAKYFSLENDVGQMEDVLYIGKVDTYDRKSNYWHIIYEDGVSEATSWCKL